MKKIKFKAWDARANKMIKHDFAIVGENGRVYISDEKNSRDYITLLQFTGLKDDLEQDIYEGDIMIDISGNQLIVEWNDDTCVLQFSDGSPFNTGDNYATYKLVIGNIYENPELLKERTTI